MTSVRVENPWATPGGIKTPRALSPSTSIARVARSVGDPCRRSCRTTRARPLRHRPVIRLMEVVVQAYDRAGLTVGPVGLHHLTAEREPAAAVRLDEHAPLVPVAVRFDNQYVLYGSDSVIVGTGRAYRGPGGCRAAHRRRGWAEAAEAAQAGRAFRWHGRPRRPGSGCHRPGFYGAGPAQPTRGKALAGLWLPTGPGLWRRPGATDPRQGATAPVLTCSRPN